MQNVETIFKKLMHIKAFIFDVDGVMTNGNVMASEDGQFLRNFNIKDGYALQHAIKSGYIIAIISGGNSIGIKIRFENLGVKDIFIGQEDKSLAFSKIINKYDLKLSEILYMGDDMPDYKLMETIGFAACPKDAATDIKSICHYVSSFNGGNGCVRDILEKTMKIQSKWFKNKSHQW